MDIMDETLTFKSIMNKANKTKDNGKAYQILLRKYKRMAGDPEFAHVLEDMIYKKFIGDVCERKFKSDKEISTIAQYIKNIVIESGQRRWYA